MDFSIFSTKVREKDNSVRRVTNSDPRDRIVYHIHKRMLLFFFVHTFGSQHFNKSIFTFKYPAFTSVILNKTDIILTFFVTSLNDEIT